MKGEGTGYDPDEFTTVSGARVHVLNPNPEAIRLGDIAHGLSRVCRFGGQVGIHMSVAQHCVLVSDIVKDHGGSLEEQMLGLMHDATEAYVGDVISPLKKQLDAFHGIEAKWATAIGQTLGFGDKLANLPEIVHDADTEAFYTEWRDCFPDRAPVVGARPSPNRHVYPMAADQAREAWLRRYDELRAALDSQAATE